MHVPLRFWNISFKGGIFSLRCLCIDLYLFQPPSRAQRAMLALFYEFFGKSQPKPWLAPIIILYHSMQTSSNFFYQTNQQRCGHTFFTQVLHKAIGINQNHSYHSTRRLHQPLCTGGHSVATHSAFKALPMDFFATRTDHSVGRSTAKDHEPLNAPDPKANCIILRRDRRNVSSRHKSAPD